MKAVALEVLSLIARGAVVGTPDEEALKELARPGGYKRKIGAGLRVAGAVFQRLFTAYEEDSNDADDTRIIVVKAEVHDERS